MASCHQKNADSAPSTRSAHTCSNSRNDRLPHVRLGSQHPRARNRPLSFPSSEADLAIRRYSAFAMSCRGQSISESASTK
jgi:hypothetical protein